MPNVWPYWMDQGTGGQPNYTVQVWQDWAQTSATIPINYADPWNAWQAQAATVPTVTAGSTVWAQWQVITNATVGVNLASGYVPPEPSPEEQARRKRLSLIQRSRSRAYQFRRNIAARKAEALLLENLSAEQREEWRSGRAFTVHTAGGKRAYRIAYGLAGNVRLLEAAEPPSKHGLPIRVGARFCMHVYHPDGQVPYEDNVLAQKLLIESNEARFLELANVS